MSEKDTWLLERAAKRKAREARPLLRGAARLKTAPPIDGLWKQLQDETKRQAAVYTEAVGDSSALTVETPADEIIVSHPDGRQITIRVNRAERSLWQITRERSGGIRMGKPLIRFVVNSQGELTFNFGGLHSAASTVLRRLVD